MEWIDIVTIISVIVINIIGWAFTLQRQKTNEAKHLGELGEKVEYLHGEVSRSSDKLDNVCERVSRIEGRLNGFFSK